MFIEFLYLSIFANEYKIYKIFDIMGDIQLLSVNDILIKNPQFTCKEIDSKFILINKEDKKYYSLDETGKYIWELLDIFKTIDEITDQLIEKYEVSKSECAKDVVLFVDKLIKNKIIIAQ